MDFFFFFVFCDINLWTNDGVRAKVETKLCICDINLWVNDGVRAKVEKNCVFCDRNLWVNDGVREKVVAAAAIPRIL